jgi:cyclopropane fatty-acyl-phospholipid synthase-like methyltransferase
MLNHLLRYEPVVHQVEATPGRTLLEVGSGSRGIARYVSPRWELTACDVSFSDYEAPIVGFAGPANRVEASVLEMPFADDSFDVVVALDLLEHLPADDRPQALAQLRRVARKRLIVGCPTSVGALASDERLAQFYQRIRRPMPIWLEEHLRNGFPDIETLTEHLSEEGELVLVANESLTAHALVSRVEALPVLWRLTTALASALAPGLENPRWGAAARRMVALLRADDRLPAYRTIAILSIDTTEVMT